MKVLFLTQTCELGPSSRYRVYQLLPFLQKLGVEPEVFDTFYFTVMATFRDILGTEWTAAMERTWTDVVRELTRPSM